MNKELNEVKPWPFNGYAPGNYMNTCSICKKDVYNVDKLCFVCLECAVKLAKHSPSLREQPLREAMEKIHEIRFINGHPEQHRYAAKVAQVKEK